MALRRPIYITSGGDLRTMDEDELNLMRTQAVREFALSNAYRLT